jgi:aminoglycoside phosphotransferase (APT) family kinase protein
VLRELHRLPVPPFELPALEPFVRQRERIGSARTLSDSDRNWLFEHLTGLEARYAGLPAGMPFCAIHGDAWAGNVVVTDADGPVLLDLERFAYGPPEWDLTSIAVDYTTFGELTGQEWAGFSERYGYDVTTWDGFEVLRDARELRKVTFAFQMADQQPRFTTQAEYRLACVQGKHGPRPWGWTGVV